MITLYYRGSCNSSQRALAWFESNKIKVNIKKMSSITEKDLITLLSLTNKGIEEIVKGSSKCSPETNLKISKLYEMTLNEGICYIRKNYDILQSPIILEKNKFLIGYNVDEIRKFIPRSYRVNKLKKLK